MKNTIKLIASFCLVANMANAQHWANTANQTVNTYRSGRVGIGTPFSATVIPQSLLHLKSNSSQIPFMIENTAVGQQNIMNAYFSTNPATGVTLGAGSLVFQPSNPTGQSDLLFMSNTTTAGLVLKGNSWVGIGTTTPTEKLHVHNGSIRISGQATQGGAMMLFGGNSNNFGDWGIEYMPNTFPKPGLNFWKPFGSNGTGGNHFLFLADNGRVGVNTDNPTAQLTVNGNVLIGDPITVTIPNNNYKLFVQTGILTEKVKVALINTNDWADYVFDKNYKLNSLEDVSAYIKLNKHLPGVASANELVEAGGFDLGKMDAKLLEKIEELTLYTIQLNEKNKELEERLKKLEVNRN
jgi:hypothetical protein